MTLGLQTPTEGDVGWSGKVNTNFTTIDSIFGSSQGMIAYRDASAWQSLSPGTSGQFLQTQGAGANPVWATVSAGSTTGVTGWPSAVWSTGGGFTAGSPELLGPTDAGFYLNASQPASTGDGKPVQVTGGAANTTGAGGTATLQGGAASGASQNGANAIVAAGLGTGNAATCGHVQLRTGFPNSTSSSTAQSIGDRVFVCGLSKTQTSPTSGTAIVFANLQSISSNTSFGCTCSWICELNDGTHWGTAAGEVVVAVANNGGTITVNWAQASGTMTCGIAGGTFGTIACTASVAASGSNAQLKLTPSWTTGTPTTARITYTIIANGPTTVSPQ